MSANDAESPSAAFSEPTYRWAPEDLKKLSEEWSPVAFGSSSSQAATSCCSPEISNSQRINLLPADDRRQKGPLRT